MSFLKRYVGCQHCRVLLEGGTPGQAHYKTGFFWALALLSNTAAIGFIALGRDWFPLQSTRWFTDFFLIDQDDTTHLPRLVLALLLVLGGLTGLPSASPAGVAFQRASREEFERLEAPMQAHVMRSVWALKRLVVVPAVLFYLLAYKLKLF